MLNKRILSVIIPVFNEEKTVREIIFRAAERPEVGQIIVVDDGSTDQTKDILKGPLPDIAEVIRSEVNNGKGWAIAQALPRVSCDIVIIQDADLEYDPAEYNSLLSAILNENLDAVYGDRLSLSHFLKHPLHFLANKWITFVFNAFHGGSVRDMACGYKMFRRKAVAGLEMTSKRFEFDVELSSKILKRGIKIISVPISYIPRSHADGKKFCWGDRWKHIAAVFRI